MPRTDYDSPNAPEITLLPEQFEPNAPEHTPPPEEFSSGNDAPERRKKRRQFRFSGNAILAVLCVVVLAASTRQADSAAPPEPELPVPVIVSPQEPEPEPEPGLQPEPEPEPQPEPEPEPEPVVLNFNESVATYHTWKSEDADVWLHFDNGTGWMFDGTSFHPLTWSSDGDEYGHYESAFAQPAPDLSSVTSTLSTGDYQLLAPDLMYGPDTFTEGHENFVPAELQVNTSYVDSGFGRSTVEMLAAIGKFWPIEVGSRGDYAYDGVEMHGITSGLLYAGGKDAVFKVNSTDAHPASIEVERDTFDFGNVVYMPEVLEIYLTYREDGYYIYLISMEDSTYIVNFSDELVPPKPDYQTFPLSEGMIYVTVYNNSFDMSAADDPYDPYARVLMRKEIPESEFTELVLPEPDYVGGDWEYTGYAIQYNGAFDRGRDESNTYGTFARPIGDILSWDEVEWVPPSEDGVRYVNIHAMWRSRITDHIKMPLVFDDGMGNTTTYEGDTPFASEGYAYVYAYPVPEREGYRFTGWYDSEGNLVEAVAYTDFLDYNSAEGDYDWTHPHPFVLYAGWEPV